MQHVHYPSIGQFRTAINEVKGTAAYHGIPIPTLRFRGTIKAHGTNSGIASQYTDGVPHIWAQSRDRCLAPDGNTAGTNRTDNYGFCKDMLVPYVQAWSTVHGYARGLMNVPNDEVLTIFGEWCGQGVKKGAAVSQLPKTLILFGIAAGPSDNRRWATDDEFDSIMNAVGHAFDWTKVYSVRRFPVHEIEIDFNNPELSQPELANLTHEVEVECPIGKHFGIIGIGEGIVWSPIDPPAPFAGRPLAFKVKGEKHSVTKVRTLAEVDIEKVNSVNEFVTKVVTVNRLEQMRDALVENGLDKYALTSLGPFLKMVGQDVIKEELDTIEASGLETKDVMPKVNAFAKQWFMLNRVEQPAS